MDINPEKYILESEISNCDTSYCNFFNTHKKLDNFNSKFFSPTKNSNIKWDW